LPTLRRLDNHRIEGVKRQDAGLYFRQLIEVGAQYRAPQDKICELAFANELDQAGSLEFLNVMREGRGANALLFVQGGARGRRVVLPDLLENLNAPGLGERAGDARELAIGQERDA
jgi:hypothetical protein